VDSTNTPKSAIAEDATVLDDLATQRVIEGLNRYGGNPDLLIEEHPHRRRADSAPPGDSRRPSRPVIGHIHRYSAAFRAEALLP